MPGPFQYSLSRRALLAGCAAVLAGCSADDPHDGDPDAEAVTAAPVPMTGPERLAAIEQSDLSSFDPPSLVTDGHLAERLGDLEALARDVEELLEETPTAAELAGRGEDDRRHDDRLDRIERVRRQAGEAVTDARHLLEEERERDGQAPGRQGYMPQNEIYLTRANNRVERLSVSLWMVRIVHDRATVAELPGPADVETRLRDVRASITYRCDGSGLGVLYLSEVEQTLRSALQSIADFEERAEQRSDAGADGDAGAGGDADGSGDASGEDADATEDASGRDADGAEPSNSTTGRAPPERLPVDRINETVSAHARARVRLLDARQYLARYEARIGSSRRCGDRLRATVDELRRRVTQQYSSLGDRLPARGNGERPTDDSGDGSRPRQLVRSVRRQFAMPEGYHERRLSRTEEFEQDGWLALPCRELARHLLWYRSTATAIEQLPDGSVEHSERLELVTTAHEAAVERFTAAVDASRDDQLGRRYLRYAAGALGQAEEILTSLDPDATDTRDGHQQLVRAYPLLLQAHGISANAAPVSRLVRDA